MSRGRPTGPDRDVEALHPTGAPSPVIPLTTAQPTLGRRGGIWAAAAVLLVLAGGVAVGLRAWLDDGADAAPFIGTVVYEPIAVPGSCDGALAPPAGGQSWGTGPSAAAALEAFFSVQDAIDPPLDTGVYARYGQREGGILILMAANPDGTRLLIKVERTRTGTKDGDGNEWTVTYAAAC
jgi:hypothetical protein